MGCGASAAAGAAAGEEGRREAERSSKHGSVSSEASAHQPSEILDAAGEASVRGGLAKVVGNAGRRGLPDMLDPDVRLASGPTFAKGLNSLFQRGDSKTAREKHQEDLIALFAPLMKEHTRFLMNFVMTFQQNQWTKTINFAPLLEIGVAKPYLETRAFKSHTMDNVRVRKVCDEMLSLEDPNHKMADETAKGKPWMRTLQVSRGKHIHCIKMNNNSDVTIGGYFIISQMLGYIRGLVSLDLSSNELKGAEARVLALGMKYNKSVQDLRLKENSIGSEGATSMAEVLKANNTLMLLDLRMNNIRGPGVCVLTDAMAGNRTLTDLDLRWNYAGESSDYVEQALLDLQRFCARNMQDMIVQIQQESNQNQQEVSESPRVVSEASTKNNLMESSGHEVAVEANGQANGQANGHGPADPDQSQLVVTPQRHILPALNMNNDASLESTTISNSLITLNDENTIIGRLEVTIISAKNLPQVIWTSGKDGEFLGLPQAYCVFQLNQEREQTSIMRKDWNPLWNHTFSMNVRSVWNVIGVKVMHSKTLSRTHRDDSTIGTANLPVGAVINWRGVSKSSDGQWRSYHRPHAAGRGTTYTVCRGRDREGNETDTFDTAELAARAYDERATKMDQDKAVLNFAGDSAFIGAHVKEELFPLAGEDGVDVIGVQAGVKSTIRMRLKYFDSHTNYLEINLERASSLPKMDSGLGSCDAYVVIIVDDYQYKSRVVRNSLDPEFNQTFRIAVRDETSEMELRVQLWDWDRFDEDDHMGDVVMKLSIDKIISGSLNGGYGVIASEGMDYVKNAQGEKSIIHLRFSYFPGSANAQTSLAATPKTLSNKIPMLI